MSIVTTGRIIRIEVGGRFLERTSDGPGVVTVREGSQIITLPANPEDMERFIKAYRRACLEEVGYRKSEVE